MPTEEEIIIYGIIAATFLALVGLIVQIYFRQGKIESTLEYMQKQFDASAATMRQEFQTTREEFKTALRGEGEAWRTETKRLVDAILPHSHDRDGTVVYRVPLPAGTENPATGD